MGRGTGRQRAARLHPLPATGMEQARGHDATDHRAHQGGSALAGLPADAQVPEHSMTMMKGIVTRGKGNVGRITRILLLALSTFPFALTPAKAQFGNYTTQDKRAIKLYES